MSDDMRKIIPLRGRKTVVGLVGRRPNRPGGFILDVSLLDDPLAVLDGGSDAVLLGIRLSSVEMRGSRAP